jgi:hypothetical protein
MECSSCHQEIPPDSQFCTYCGTSQEQHPVQKPVSAPSTTFSHESNAIPEPPPADTSHSEPIPASPSPGIIAGTDGVLRWAYEMSMWKNSTIPKTIAKVVIFASIIPALLVTFLTLDEGLVDAAKVFIRVAGLVLGIMAVLFLLAYIIVSVTYGGKYCVVFEMDTKGVKHIQMQKQFKKGQVLSILTVLAGVAAGSPQTAGAGLLAGARNSSYSSFQKVIHVVADPKREVIYVNEIIKKNQVYAAPEDFEAVFNYLAEHCKKAKISRKS